MTKKESYFSDKELLKLAEILSKASFWEEFEKECAFFDKEIDKMREIPISILREPMTI